jgi:molybdopterin-guanine dinucleotide biosynthesis protein A
MLFENESLGIGLIMKNNCTGVILAGGRNSRFSGKNKALIPVAGKRILDRIHDVFTILFDNIMLVTNDPLQYMPWNFDIVTDIFPIRSALTGIHTGLFYVTTPYAFFTGCDIPFLKKELVEILLASLEPGIDIVIPETSQGFEPLCAIYSKRCLKPIEQHLLKKSFKIQRIFQKVHVKKIGENILRSVDPDLTSFSNINTPDDLSRVEESASDIPETQQ